MLQDIPITPKSKVRCPKCLEQVPETADRCERCGEEIQSPVPKTLLGKIKRVLGIDLSSDIVTINLEDNGRFFSNQEIDALLDMENVTVLGLEDVPDRDTIFYKSKRIRKPAHRNKS